MVVLEQPKSAEDQQVDNLVSDFKRELIKTGGAKAFISRRLAYPMTRLPSLSTCRLALFAGRTM